MRDEKVCQVLLALKPFEQIHDLRLDRNVESGDWFVGDDEVGIDRQGACDANALTLPARELVWIAFDKAPAQADGLHQILHPAFGFPAARQLKCVERFADNLPDSHARIQRSIRILKNNLQMPPLIAHLSGRELS